MSRIANCRWCGSEFEQTSVSNFYCCNECLRDAMRQSMREYKERQKWLNRERRPGDFPTIDEAVNIAMQMPGKHIVTYGMLQAMIRTGKIKVKGGVVV